MEYIVSDKGARENNEDSFCVKIKDNKRLYIVADGCGGHSSGEVASKYVVDCLPDLLFDANPMVESIKNVLDICNVKIIEKQKQYMGMRTTVVGLYQSGSMTFAFNIGDSRLYQIRNGQIVFNTEDHSVPYLLYKAEIIGLDEINTHEDRSKLLEALGNKEKIKMNVYELDVNSDDMFVLASDGFWEHFYARDFEDCIISNAEKWLDDKKSTIILKNDPEQDNFTAIVVGGLNE